MSQNFKRVLSIILIVFTVFAWYVTIFGIGKIEPIKDKLNLGLDIKGGVYVVMEAQTDYTGEELSNLMEQTKTVMENRVYEMGFSEAVVTIEGSKRLRIELPGAEDAEEAISQIGQVAQLQFMLADGTVVVDGGNVKDATAGTSQESTGYVVNIQFDSEGASKFEEGSRKAFYGEVENKMQDQGVSSNKCIAIVLDDNIITAPEVQNVISGGSCQITGNYTSESASNLAALIRGGSLPVTLKEVTSSTQSASIGYNALEKSVIAGAIGFALIFILMIAAYRFLGLIANVALLLYIILVLWAMAFSGSTLTLPGIAGIILGIGMAVDANVIIFSRIREEMSAGKSVRISCESGFHNALSAIMDGQITTLIAGVVLYEVGSATVKGFAVTLMLGVIFSIISGVLITRLYLETFIGLKREEPKKSLFGVKEDGSASFHIRKFFHVLRHRKIYYIISIAIILCGFIVGGIRGFNYGIDFTGGTTMTVEMNKQVDFADVNKVLDEFDAENVSLVYGGTDNTQIIIRTTTFFDNDARAEIFDAMQAELGCPDDGLIASEQFGPAVGDELKANAVKAVLIAALCMLIYIVVRFRKVPFGVAALAGVFHDVLIVIAFYGIFHITINNPFIAGILTVVGYSINDTIVIFDRIRENLGLTKKRDLMELTDTSVNQVLGRSLMTSATTLIVMIPMYIMVSASIRQFILPLMVGVIVGAASSIFVCSPIYYDLTKLSEKRKNNGGGGSKKKYQGAPKKEKEKPKDYGEGAIV